MSGRAARVALAVALMTAVVWTAAPAPAMSSANAASKANARRVLVLSLGTLTWDDHALSAMPHLRALLSTSGVADMTLHGATDHPSLEDGYLTINTGARAAGTTHAPSPPCAQSAAAIECAAYSTLVRHNDKLLFDAKVGLLGDTLARAGVGRAVFGSPTAALALVDKKGAVPAGDLRGYARDGFARAWNDRSVVLVEVPQGEPVSAFDADIGEMLQRVDLAHDAVIVVAPAQRVGPLTTTVAALHAPGLRPGLLTSAFTRRSGTVGLIDAAPTILDQLGIERPAHVEGRPFVFGRHVGDFPKTLEWVTDTNARALFRDQAITEVAGVFMACEFVLAGAALLVFGWPRLRRGRAALQLAALTLLFFLPATYLAMQFSFARNSLPEYWAVTIVLSVVPASVVYFAIARTSLLPVMIALGAIAALIAVDVVTGARLQFNGTFGYSPSIGGRYAGLGNQGYAMLAAAAVLLAGLIVGRFGRRGLWAAAVILAVAIVVDGLPLFGADVGGVLSMVPAFGVAAAMLAGWRFRWRLLAAFAGLAVAVLGAFALVDLARPAGQRSHLGRLLAGGSGGGADFGVVLQRKIAENVDVVASTRFTWILPVVYAVMAYVVYRAPGPLRVVRDRLPALNAALAGLGLVALLGTILNDSGIAITGVMFGVVTSTLVFLCARVAVP